MIGLVTFVIVIVSVLMLFTFFKTFSRIRTIQNRVFDVVEQRLNAANRDDESESAQQNSPRDYTCGQCGASLGDRADVSPSGDFKCTYCGKWSNIHA